ncbi:MAG: DUF1501 domain-containing protein [Rhodopirellula sp.]|nr:DUF1501 domain-containing protein [Rhodopirellula sp.]
MMARSAAQLVLRSIQCPDDWLFVLVDDRDRADDLSKTNDGRDHHPRCFSVLMAGAGIKTGTTYGETDDYGYNIVDKPVHVHDLNATMMHLLGVDHTRLTYRYQGRDFRLTDIHGEVVEGVLA